MTVPIFGGREIVVDVAVEGEPPPMRLESDSDNEREAELRGKGKRWTSRAARVKREILLHFAEEAFKENSI